MPPLFFNFIRFLIFLVLALLGSFFIPLDPSREVTNSLFAVLLVFSFSISFLINRAMERKKTLRTSIAIELSRLRRVNHMSEKMSDGIWRKDVRAALIHYQEKIGQNFLAYKELVGGFRAWSHLIYGYEPKNRQEELLFDDLLATTRDLALERQNIEQALNDRLDRSGWFFLSINTAFLLILLLWERTSALINQWTTGLAMTAVMMVVDFLFLTNALTRSEIQEIQLMYQKNIPKSRE